MLCSKSEVRQDTYRNSEAGRHTVKVIWMLAHRCDLGNNCIAGPFDTKDLRQLLEVLSCRFSYREDGVAEPAHAQCAQLVIEELYT